MILKIVCAWCGKEMGEKEFVDQPEIEKNISHSICKDCLDREIAGIGRNRRTRDSVDQGVSGRVQQGVGIR
jgi:hypothetical protein